MASALLTAVLLGIVFQVLAIYYGYQVPRAGAFARHFSWALAATFLLSFAHSMTMFFFIGTGKQIKETVREKGLQPDIVAATVLYKQKLFPPIMFAIVMTAAQFILGGGTHTKVIPAWVHQIMAWVTLGANLYCFMLEGLYLAQNSQLMVSVYRDADWQRTADGATAKQNMDQETQDSGPTGQKQSRSSGNRSIIRSEPDSSSSSRLR